MMISIPPYLVNLPSCILYLALYGDPNGGTTFRDRSTSRKTITRSGNVVNSTAQKQYPPGSMYFDGSSSLYAPISSDFNFGSSDFAISTWVLTTSPTSSQGLICHSPQGGSSGRGWLFYRVTGYVCFYCFDSNSTQYGTDGAISMTSGVWYHLAVIRKGTTVTIYANGSVIGSFTPPTSIRDVSVITDIGKAQDSGVFYLTGNVDEIAIWNGALGKVPTISQLYPMARRMIV